MSDLNLKLLFVSGGDEPFIDHVENSLAQVIARAGGQVLRVVEGRDIAEGTLPTIDACEASPVSEEPRPLGSSTPASLQPIIDNTRWYARVSGYPHDTQAIDERITAAAALADDILRNYQPDVVVVWNGLLGTRAVFASRAQAAGIPVRYAEKGALPGSWYLDPLGVNGYSTLVREPLPERLRNLLSHGLTGDQRAAAIADYTQIASSGASAWGQAGRQDANHWRERLGIAPSRPVLFFPLQVDADTNMRFFSPHFECSLDALRAVAPAARELGWFLLVKPHPKGAYPPGEIERLLAGVGAPLSDINVHDAIELSQLVVTVNSTVAAEACWHDRPVLQLGRGILSGKQIVAEYSPDRPVSMQLREACAVWRDDRARYERSLAMFHYLRHDYLLDSDVAACALRLADHLMVQARSGCGRDAESMAGTYAWAPAIRLLDDLAIRCSLPTATVLVGFGRNARRLLHAARRHAFGRRITWLAWDESPDARQLATQAGIPLWEPNASNSPRPLLVVTPSHPEGVIQRLRRMNHGPSDWIELAAFLDQPSSPAGLCSQ